ncbi:Bestrophin/UPF0187 [Trinorchestia longiramus]|nr:Bestrophin/UPF0187 [Trinorchestia longiramus]
MTAQEKKIFEDLDRKTTHPKYWMPLVWAGTIVARARKEGRIRDDFAVKSLIDEISKFRGLSGGLLSYDWISIPLVYTQVVTLAVYTFFIGTIMGRQFLDPTRNIPNYTVDFYVPWFTFLQFFFYMGWLKVAESLVNPFGEDDDDFEVNWLIDRNLQVSYLIVDEMHEEHPELIQDAYWDEVFPQSLPYTVASEGYRRMAPQGSTFNMQVPEAEQEILLVPLEEEDENEGKDAGHVKINMHNARTSRESLQSSSSGIAMKVRSPRNSMSAERKGSMLSVLLNRVMHSGAGDGSTTRFSRLGSSLSIRSKRTGVRVHRNSSRLSAISRVSSRDSFSSPRPRGLPSSPSVAHSAISADEGASEMPHRWLNREVSMDEEGAILIRIKPDSERKPHFIKSTGEGVSLKSIVAPTSTSSQTTSVSPTSSVSKHPSVTMPSSTSSAPLVSRSSLAKLPPLPIGRRAVAGKPNLTPLQTGSVSSAGTGSHLLSQELGSDDEVQTQPHFIKSTGEGVSLKSIVAPTSTSSQTTSVSPTSSVSKHPSVTMPSSTSSAPLVSRSSLARLPPLPIGRRAVAGKPNLTPLQTGSVSSAGTGSHMLSQELGSDDEVQTPWGPSDPPTPECDCSRDCRTGDTGTVRRKGKGGNPPDDPPTSARSQPCPVDDVLGDTPTDSGLLQRGVSVPNGWASSSNEPRMFDFLSSHDCEKTGKYPSGIGDPGGLDSSKSKKDPSRDGNFDGLSVGGQGSSSNIDESPMVCNAESQDPDDQTPFGGHSDSATSAPASPTSKVFTRECLLQPMLEPESSNMSLSDRFSTLIKDTSCPVGIGAPEPDGPPISLHSRKASSIPDGLDIVDEENETVEEDSDNATPANIALSAPISSSKPETTSADGKATAMSDPISYINESSKALSNETGP